MCVFYLYLYLEVRGTKSVYIFKSVYKTKGGEEKHRTGDRNKPYGILATVFRKDLENLTVVCEFLSTNLGGKRQTPYG